MSTNKSHSSEDDDTGSDVDLFLLSQDIDSAIERFLPSSSPDHTHSCTLREEFFPEKLNNWDLTACSNDNEGTEHVQSKGANLIYNIM